MSNDITILSCPQCGFPRIRDCGNGLYQCDDCGTHFDKDENIVLTEQEYIQTCNTEQLADVLAKQKCDGCNDEPYDEEYGVCKYCMAKRMEQVREWLKQPHRGES